MKKGSCDVDESNSILVHAEMTMPLVSIVIPAYNHASYLKEAIESVLAQDYPNIELIVLNDGSTDGTDVLLKQYGNRFYWENQQNIGQAETLNKGWTMAKGEILSYLSADDFLVPSAVSSSVKYLSSETVLTYCDFDLVDQSSKKIRRVAAPEFNYVDMFTKYICHPGPGVFMLRTAFEQAGFWNSSLRQMPDYDYWLRLGLIGDFKKVPQVLASFRVHGGSQTHAKADEKKAEEPIKIIREFIEKNKSINKIESLSKEALSNAYLVSAQLHIRANRFEFAFRNLKIAISIWPAILIKPRTFRVLANGLFNHILHKMIGLKNRFF